MPVISSVPVTPIPPAMPVISSVPVTCTVVVPALIMCSSSSSSSSGSCRCSCCSRPPFQRRRLLPEHVCCGGTELKRHAVSHRARRSLASLLGVQRVIRHEGVLFILECIGCHSCQAPHGVIDVFPQGELGGQERQVVVVAVPTLLPAICHSPSQRPCSIFGGAVIATAVGTALHEGRLQQVLEGGHFRERVSFAFAPGFLLRQERRPARLQRSEQVISTLPRRF